jgi:hypothetical protein
VIDKVGVDIKSSEKSAVMVTVSVFLTLRLMEVEDKFRLGGYISDELIFISLIHPIKGSFGEILPEGVANSLPFPTIPYLGVSDVD